MFIDENIISSSSLVSNIINFVIDLSLFFALIFFICRGSCSVFLKEISDFLCKLIGNNSVEQLSFLFLQFFFNNLFLSFFSHMIILGNFKLLNLDKKYLYFSSELCFFFHLTKNCIPCCLLSGKQYFLFREIKPFMVQWFDQFILAEIKVWNVR